MLLAKRKFAENKWFIKKIIIVVELLQNIYESDSIFEILKAENKFIITFY